MVDHLRAGSVRQRDDIAQRHQPVGIGAHVIFAAGRCAFMRNGSSACTYTRYERLLKSKSLTYSEPMYTLSACRHLVERHANGLRLFAVDLHQLLRVVGGEAGKQSRSDLGAGGWLARWCEPRWPDPATCCGPGPAVRIGIHRSCRCLESPEARRRQRWLPESPKSLGDTRATMSRGGVRFAFALDQSVSAARRPVRSLKNFHPRAKSPGKANVPNTSGSASRTFSASCAICVV